VGEGYRASLVGEVGERGIFEQHRKISITSIFQIGLIGSIIDTWNNGREFLLSTIIHDLDFRITTKYSYVSRFDKSYILNIWQ